MQEIIRDLVSIARKCRRASRLLLEGDVNSLVDRVTHAVNEITKSWSGSWIGYQANVYYRGFCEPPPGCHFDSEWGFERSSMGGFLDVDPNEGWSEVTNDEVRREVLQRAGNPDLEAIKGVTKKVEAVFVEGKQALLATLDARLADHDDARLLEVRAKVDKLKSHFSKWEYIDANAPQQLSSRDSKAIHQGRWTPPHLDLLAQVLEGRSYGEHVKALEEHATSTRLYLEKRGEMSGKRASRRDGKIFIGHGASPLWNELALFISDRLGLEYDEFNRESAAGKATKERLEDMLDGACFALLIMTAEDEHFDGSQHARENVIHEIGLFQGRLGFDRAIVALEEGCTEFSNIRGLTQIRFPKGKIKACYDDVRQVLEREGLL